MFTAMLKCEWHEEMASDDKWEKKEKKKKKKA